MAADTGSAIWRSDGSDEPTCAHWDGTQFLANEALVAVGEWRIMAGARALMRDESIVVGVTQGSEITGLMQDTSGWSALPFNPLSSVSETYWWGIDVAYESISGDALLVWNNGTSGTESISWRTWDGTAWSAESTLTTPLSGEAQHMHLASNPVNDDEIILIASNASSQDYALVWDGDEWGDDIILDTGSGDDRTDIAAAFEHITGFGLIAYGKGTDAVYSRVWNGSVWGAEDTLAPPVDAGGDVRWITMACDPGSQQIVLGVLTNDNDIWLAVWTGNAWDDVQTATNSAPGVTHPAVAVAFEGTSGEALAVYGEGSEVKYRSWAVSPEWSEEATALSPGATPNSMTLRRDPNSDAVMLAVQDDDNDLNYMPWDGSSWGSSTELETNTSEDKNQPFIFLWEDSTLGNEQPVLAPIGDKTATETVNLTFDVSATDAESTPTLSTSALPDGASFVDNGDGSGEFSWTPGYPSEGDYDVTFYATDDMMAVDSEVVTITVESAISYLQIEYSDGTPVGDTTLSVDNDTTEFFCRAYTSGDALLGEAEAEWSISEGDSVGSLSPLTGTSTVLELTAVGVAKVMARRLPADDVYTGWLTCGGGAPVRIEVSPATTTVAVDSSVQFTAISYDADSNESLPQAVPSWEVLGGIGSISGGGLFTATSDGTGQVVASAGPMADTADPVIVVSTAPAYLTITPEIDSISADSIQQFVATAFTELDDTTDAGTIMWSLTNDLGPIDAAGLFEPTTVGVTAVVAQSSLGPADTTAEFTVVAGELATLAVSPDSVSTYIDSTVSFTASGADSDGNSVDPGSISWSVVGSVGAIDGSGLFTATQTGTGRIAAASSDPTVVDTSAYLGVLSGELASLSMSPDTATVVQGDSLQFLVAGLDAVSDTVEPGEVVWEVLGNIGSISADGMFHATDIGYGRVLVRSVGGELADTSGVIAVETVVSTIHLGSSQVRPGQEDVCVLAFRVDNYLGEPKSIEAITIRDASRGQGSAAQRRTAIEAVSLYLDADDDSTLSAADQLLATGTLEAPARTFSFSPVPVATYEGINFLVGVDLSLEATDGDSLDLYLDPAIDIETSDASVLAGPAEVNSSGWAIVDGMVAAQIGIDGQGTQALNPGAGAQRLVSLDIPRNGYLVDTLDVLSLVNLGTASSEDLDSVLLCRDDGDGVWSGAAHDTQAGILQYTGQRWVSSGLSEPLSDAATRFHVVGVVSSQAPNGVTFSMGVPLNGVEMASGNDGPIDTAVPPEDTVVLVATEALSVAAVNLPATSVIPGETSSPLLAFTMTNTLPEAVTIDGLVCSLVAADPQGASLTDLYSQVDSVLLYEDIDGDPTSLGEDDILLSTATLAGGVADLSVAAMPLSGSGGTRTFILLLAANLANAKNGNSIGLTLNDASSIDVSPVTAIAGEFPIANGSAHTIDGFPAATVTVNDMETVTLYGGQNNQLALDLTLPANGYADDQLDRFTIRNLGSLNDHEAIARARLWADRTNDGFTADDYDLGGMQYVMGTWEATSVAYNLLSDANRFFVTVDLSEGQFQGGTIRFEIVQDGLTYLSGADGPDDAGVSGDQELLVFPSDRITVISVPRESRVVAPGTDAVPLLTFALYNGYVGQPRVLTGLTVTNASRTVGGDPDEAVGQVYLYHDADGNRLNVGDPLVASGRFTDGSLSLNGINVSLPDEELTYLFICSDMSLRVSDGDSLAAAVNLPSDLGFDGAANVNGDMPVSAGGYTIADGSIAQQYEVLSIPSATAGAGETNRLLMAVRLPSNGSQGDTLQSLAVRNVLDADTSEFDNLALWLDADNSSTLSLSDFHLADFGFVDGSWIATGLAFEVPPGGSTVLMVADIAATATPGTAFQGVLPIDGCQYASGNDGPRDSAVTSSAIVSISNSPLALVQQNLPSGVGNGDTLSVQVTARNLSAYTMTEVSLDVIAFQDSTLVSSLPSDLGPKAILPGDSGLFVLNYVAEDLGELNWELQAVAPVEGDTSAVLHVGPLEIQQTPTSTMATLIASIPPAVTVGQSNVFPLTLVLEHADSSSDQSALRLDRLMVFVEDGAGTAVAANDVFSRLVLSSKYTTLSVLDPPPSNSTVTFVFTSPVTIEPGASGLFSLLVDIAPEAVPGSFRLGFAEASSIPALDEYTLGVVPFDDAVNFPLITPECRIHQPADAIAVSWEATLGARHNYGQRDAAVFDIMFRHVGPEEASQVQITGLNVGLQDTLGQPWYLSAVCDELKVLRSGEVIGHVQSVDLETESASVTLTSPPTLSALDTVQAQLAASVRFDAQLSEFRFVVSDSADMIARELTTGLEMPIITDTLILAASSAFPMVTDWTQLGEAALPVEVCVSQTSPEAVVGGTDGVPLIGLILTYPAAAECSPVRLRGVSIDATDGYDYPVPAATLFDQIGYSVAGGAVNYYPVNPYVVGADFSFSDTGILLLPDDSVTVDLIADFDAGIEVDSFQLSLTAWGVDAIDGTDSTVSPGVSHSVYCSDPLPFVSSSIGVLLPAGRPQVAVEGPLVQIASPGQDSVTVWESLLDYRSQVAQGDLALIGLSAHLMKRGPDGWTPQAMAGLFDEVRLYLDGELVAVDDSLSGDSLGLTLSQPAVVSSGELATLALIADLNQSASGGNYALSLTDSLFLRLVDENLAASVYPVVVGGQYPLITGQLSIEAASLAGSFTNYPNPFNPDVDEHTTIGYVLDRSASVDLEIFTITGRAVKTIASGAARNAGPHSSDTWDGRNDIGMMVVPGTYFCRIVARYVDGGTDELRRKVAVVR